MEEDMSRYSARPLISFAEDPEPVDVEWDRQLRARAKATYHPPRAEKSGIRFQRCGGGHRVIRKPRRNR